MESDQIVYQNRKVIILCIYSCRVSISTGHSLPWPFCTPDVDNRETLTLKYVDQVPVTFTIEQSNSSKADGSIFILKAVATYMGLPHR